VSFDLDASVGSLVAAQPSRARDLETRGIDYCCGGRRSLREASRERGLDPGQVAASLLASDRATADSAETPRDWTRAPLAVLVDEIVDRHHGYLRRELPRLADLTEKVRRAHAERHGELHEVAAVYAGLRAELETHLAKEENILFPLIVWLESTRETKAIHCGSLQNPIRAMEHEHDDAGAALRRLRELTADYAPPEDACASYHLLLAGLADLERDLHTHIHKENNILFPRAIRLEAELAASSSC